jgi:hypothetical protein
MSSRSGVIIAEFMKMKAEKITGTLKTNTFLILGTFNLEIPS